MVPGKGGDILSLRWLPLDIELLWSSPWGLRMNGAASVADGSTSRFLENYPGGWQTLFPNGGPSTSQMGIELGFHGEATLAGWEWERGLASERTVVMNTVLHKSPFAMRREITVEDGSLTVYESIRNRSDLEVEAMWSHHPAFGAPLISEAAEFGISAQTFLVDDGHDTATTDFFPATEGKWPMVEGKTGPIDLRKIPSHAAATDRFGYFTDLTDGSAWIANAALGIKVDLKWDMAVFPHAWYWLEAGGTKSYPWFGTEYVFAVEPASSIPGQGLAAVKQKTGTQITFAPGQTLETSVTLEVNRI